VINVHYLLLTSIAILLWASLASLALSLNHIPPFFVLSLSLLIGGSLSLSRWRSWQFQPSLLFIGVAGIFGYHFLLFMALRLAPAVSANLLNYLWPLLILLMTPLFFKEFKLTKLHIIGALISFVGAVFLISDSNQYWSTEYLVGYFLAVLAAITWSSYSLLSKKFSRFGSATVGLFCLISGVMSFISHLIFEGDVSLTHKDTLMIFLLGIGPMGVAFYSWDRAVKKGDPRVIATLSYLTPLISTFLLIIVNKQPITQAIIWSMLAIVFGAFLANLSAISAKTQRHKK
jgi:drug/metabolite transporter (DMT)-like permease